MLFQTVINGSSMTHRISPRCQAAPSIDARISASPGWSPRYTSCTWQAVLGLRRDKMRSPWATAGYLSPPHVLLAVPL